jgi:hypothetical protein
LIGHPKRGRPRSENPMVHTAVALPRDMLERLKRDAEAAGHGLSTEIRVRLGTPERDRQTLELLDAIALLAVYVKDDLAKEWHEHAYTFAAFTAGVNALLAYYQPEGDEKEPPDEIHLQLRRLGYSDRWEAIENDDSPETIGRTYARLVRLALREDDDFDERPTRLMQKDD